MKKTKTCFRCLAFVIPLACLACAPEATRLTTGPGPEDLVRVRSNRGDAIVTASVKRSLFTGLSEQGRIELCRIGKGQEFHTVFEGGNCDTFPFYPAGISYVEHSTAAGFAGKSLLYVTNEIRQTVEVFEVRGEKIRFLTSLGKFPTTTQPNGIAAFPDGSVYVSVMRPFPSKENPQVVIQQAVDTSNTVLAYQPPEGGGEEGRWSTCITGINGANGLAAGPGGRSLLVCAWHSKKVWSFARSPKTRELVREKPIELFKDLAFHPDNIKRMSEGRYELCGQTNFPATALHMITGLPVSHGGWISFVWDGKNLRSTDRTALIKGHRRAPSTALLIDGKAYAGQPIAAGVFVSPVADQR